MKQGFVKVASATPRIRVADPVYNAQEICEQAKGRWTNEWAACPRLNDPNYFWLTGEFTDHVLENERNDHWALANGYVAITPTTVDVTAYHFMDELNNWFN